MQLVHISVFLAVCRMSRCIVKIFCWFVQTDLYGLIGTVHVLLFGEYMNVTYMLLRKSKWQITSWLNRFVSFYTLYVDLLCWC